MAAWVEGYNAQDFATLELLAVADFRVDDPASGTEIAGWGAFLETARRVADTYANHRITVSRMLPLGDSAVAVQGVREATAAADTCTGFHLGDEVHHVESMVVEFVDGEIALNAPLTMSTTERQYPDRRVDGIGAMVTQPSW